MSDHPAAHVQLLLFEFPDLMERSCKNTWPSLCNIFAPSKLNISFAMSNPAVIADCCLQVMQTLKDLCKEGHTVISSIHQPRSSIFAMFDDLILLSEGRMLYSGPASQALSYFEELGHHCPQHYNPAEFLADLISVDASGPEAQQKTRYALNAHAGFVSTPCYAGDALCLAYLLLW